MAKCIGCGKFKVYIFPADAKTKHGPARVDGASILAAENRSLKTTFPSQACFAYPFTHIKRSYIYPEK